MKSYLFILLLVLVSGLLLTACDDDGETAYVEETVDEVINDECIGCEGGVCPAPVPDEAVAADEVIEDAVEEEFDPGFIHIQAPPLAGGYDDEDETK